MSNAPTAAAAVSSSTLAASASVPRPPSSAASSPVQPATSSPAQPATSSPPTRLSDMWFAEIPAEEQARLRAQDRTPTTDDLDLAFGAACRSLQRLLPEEDAAIGQAGAAEGFEELFVDHLRQLTLVTQALKQSTFFLAYHTDSATSLLFAIESHICNEVEVHPSKTEFLSILARYKLCYLNLQVCFESLARTKFPPVPLSTAEKKKAIAIQGASTTTLQIEPAAAASSGPAHAPPSSAAAAASASSVDQKKWPCGVVCRPTADFLAANGEGHYQVCMLFDHPTSASLYRVHYKGYPYRPSETQRIADMTKQHPELVAALAARRSADARVEVDSGESACAQKKASTKKRRRTSDEAAAAANESAPVQSVADGGQSSASAIPLDE